MISLFDFLTAHRDAIIADWAADKIAQAGADGDRPLQRQQAARAYDGLVMSLRDLTGEVYRTYVDQVVKPRLRAGTTVADLHASIDPLAVLIHAALHDLPDPADRRALHDQFDARLRRTYGMWDMIAAQVALEQYPKRETCHVMRDYYVIGTRLAYCVGLAPSPYLLVTNHEPRATRHGPCVGRGRAGREGSASRQ